MNITTHPLSLSSPGASRQQRLTHRSRALYCIAFSTAAFLAYENAMALVPRYDPVFSDTTFSDPQQINDWTINNGVWAIDGGTFNSTGYGSNDIATLNRYQLFYREAQSYLPDAFIFRARVLHISSTTTPGAGLVYNFQDAANYYEVTLSTTGNIAINKVVNGALSPVATATYTGAGTNVWTLVELGRTGNITTLKVNGRTVVNYLAQGEFKNGKVGFITQATAAKFDNVLLAEPGHYERYEENFDDGLAQDWRRITGTWDVAGGTYNSRAIGSPDLIVSPLDVYYDFAFGNSAPIEFGVTTPYTFYVRMLNKYAGSGNPIGLVIGADTQNYNEILFTPTGVAKVNTVKDGVKTTIATANYSGGGPNAWFDVDLTNFGSRADRNTGVTVPGPNFVRVNGITVFKDLQIDLEQPIGLITHWADAKFDDVIALPQAFAPYSQDFSGSGPYTEWSFKQSGWGVSNGTLTNTSVTQEQLAVSQAHGEYFTYHARVVNRYGGANSRVGLVYSYNEKYNDYYQVLFSPVGIAYLEKVIGGIRVPVAQHAYAGGGSNQWFDVDVIRHRTTTTVKVNGVTVFANVEQPELRGGNIGVIARWSPASFDDISLK